MTDQPARQPGTYQREDGGLEVVVGLAEYIRDMFPDEVAAIEAEARHEAGQIALAATLDAERLSEAVASLTAQNEKLRAALRKCSPGNGNGPDVCMGEAVGRAADCGLGSSHTPHLYSAAKVKLREVSSEEARDWPATADRYYVAETSPIDPPQHLSRAGRAKWYAERGTRLAHATLEGQSNG